MKDNQSMEKPSFKDNGRFDPPKPHGDWKINHRRTAYENAWIEVGHYEVMNPSGSEGIYGVVHFKNIAIAIVALDEAQNVHLSDSFALLWIAMNGRFLKVDVLRMKRH